MLISILGLLLQIETAPINEGHNITYLFWQSDPVVKFTLIVLLVFSVICWAIIGMKQRQLKQSKRRTSKFITSFWHSKTIEGMIAKGGFKKSPVFSVFKAGIASLRDQSNNNNLSFIQRDVKRAADDEVEQLEYFVPFLATTASAAPFIGLFGTVWGILQAFWKLGTSSGASSIAIVGPHIAEALIATAFGLAAAIPAVIFYNFFVNKVRLLSRDVYQFSEDLTQRIEKEYILKSSAE